MTNPSPPFDWLENVTIDERAPILSVKGDHLVTVEEHAEIRRWLGEHYPDQFAIVQPASPPGWPRDTPEKMTERLLMAAEIASRPPQPFEFREPPSRVYEPAAPGPFVRMVSRKAETTIAEINALLSARAAERIRYLDEQLAEAERLNFDCGPFLNGSPERPELRSTSNWIESRELLLALAPEHVGVLADIEALSDFLAGAVCAKSGNRFALWVEREGVRIDLDGWSDDGGVMVSSPAKALRVFRECARTWLDKYDRDEYDKGELFAVVAKALSEVDAAPGPFGRIVSRKDVGMGEEVMVEGPVLTTGDPDAVVGVAIKTSRPLGTSGLDHTRESDDDLIAAAGEYVTVECSDGLDPFAKVDGAGDKTPPYGWLQWKGTDACVDLYCECGHHAHVDAEFLYAWRCSQCGQVYGLCAVIQLVPLSDGEASEYSDPITDQ